jgi:ferredoxin
LKYTIEVDRDNCIACSVCYGTDPTHFESDASGKSQVIGGITNGTSVGAFENLKEDAQRAADSCPVTAITIK